MTLLPWQRQLAACWRRKGDRFDIGIIRYSVPNSDTIWSGLEAWPKCVIVQSQCERIHSSHTLGWSVWGRRRGVKPLWFSDPAGLLLLQRFGPKTKSLLPFRRIVLNEHFFSVAVLRLRRRLSVSLGRGRDFRWQRLDICAVVITHICPQPPCAGAFTFDSGNVSLSFPVLKGCRCLWWWQAKSFFFLKNKLR